MADVGYEDFSAAANRMLAAKKAGQPESPVDRQIFDQGDPVHGKQFYKDYAAARSGGNIPIEDWKADPSIGPYALARTALPIAAAIPDLAVAAGNNLLDPIVNVGRKLVGAEPVAPTPLPSELAKKALGVPPAPPGLQSIAETGASIVGGALPAAGAAAANAAPGVINAARAAGGSLVKNAVVAPALATGAVAASDALGGGDTARFVAGTVGGLAPSTVLSPSAWRGVQAYLTQPKYVDPRAPLIAQALDRLRLQPSYGSMATDQGKALEAGYDPGGVAGRNRAMSASLEDIGNALRERRQQLPAPTPETAPYIAAAQQARTAAANQPGYSGPPPSASSAAQELLLQNVGPRSPVDVGNTVNEINRVAGTVSPEIGNPLLARGATLQSMAIPPPPAFVGPTRPEVPYERAVSWRGNLGRQYENLPAVRGAPYGQVYPSITRDLEAGAAASPGQVPPTAFRTVMGISRNENAANELGAALDRTLGKQTATGGRNFAETINDVSQPGMGYEYRQLTGQPRPGQPASPNDISRQLADLALVSEKSYASPVQGGAREAGGGLLKSGVLPVAGAAGTVALHGMGLGPVASAIPVVASLLPVARNAIASGLMQSPNVLNVMRGGARTPYAQAPSMQDLIAALNAARVGQQVTP